MWKDESFLEYINSFSSNNYEKNDKTIIKHFQYIFKMKNTFCVVCSKSQKLKNPKISYIFKKTLVLSIIFSKFESKDEKIFQEEKLIKC